ncbi:stearoyl-CoA desaturase (delta-9 desaturase) [Marisediminitalea aggregata]|uniref:Stearoyl-CoA desaturase (Delta-9 desaturase) n=1 Tax=Marisediminitalea aggregata TaxID=634436 RepID=A0A1M5S227_9ALTE|nr:fatty acid desaturase [Marisediminitalea aggregata]MAP21796.1 acyl-CoA desaturase [Alteromonadaceae bacterium]SHH32504.1 stearoyl-CoA desaturase (delta-9 desaturase) [Marisediminitalea aggregata]HBY37986.1 acyl-CoA desaturase [Alteromonas sp.]|tara:strand:+ start:530 stop:1657 length:1128 start_codon:yes stop_codon:yes gene_type:complete
MKKPRLIITNILVFVITGLIAFVGVPYWAMTQGFDTTEIVTTLVLFYATGMSITAGYHRLWSHKTYDAHPVVKVVLAIGGAMALQNSILHWSSDHRVHHRHVDEDDKDPYSAGKGLWFSHIGWMLREYQSHRYDDYSNCKDLQKDKVVMWQHNHYLPIVLIANFGLTGFLGWLNGDIFSMILLAGVFRLVAVHHVTFFINSLAHYWGSQPYTDTNSARDNGILAFFTFGEGYHNFHHIFEYDYRNGIRWYQFDPTKWLIKGLSFVGLTKNLRTCPEERIEKARAAMQLKRASQKVSKLPNAEEVMQTLQKEYDVLLQKMTDYYTTKKRIMNLRKKHLMRSMERLELDLKYKELKHSLVLQKEKWLKVSQLEVQFA